MQRRWVLVLLLVLSAHVHAQWLNFSTPGTPRTRDGKPNLAAPTPRTADRKPDLSGVWMHDFTPVDEMRVLFGPLIDEAQKVDVPGMELGTVRNYAINILADFKPAEAPMRPKALEVLKRNLARDPSIVCAAVPGWPLVGLLSEPIKIVQSPKLTIVLYEAGNLHRQICADGRTLPSEVNFPAFLGYSAGRWEGDVYVVDSAGFNDDTARRHRAWA